MKARLVRPLPPLALLLVAALGCPPPPSSQLELPGLEAPVHVVFDSAGAPHIYAETDTDLVRVQGFLQARERFFQMDITRRLVDGTEAELLGATYNGSDIFGNDVEMRVVGLYRAAQRSYDALDAREREVLQAYADGVNAWLDRVRNGEEPLPSEYSDLELTAAKLRNWTPLDTLGIGKGIAASLSLDIDAGRMEQLQAYCNAGASADPPFDGAALLFQDVRRIAPMDPVSTVPDAGGAPSYTAGPAQPITCADVGVELAAARRYRERVDRTPFLAAATERNEREIGSNEWGVSSQAGFGSLPLIANDPHLSLDNPSTFWENHIIVADDPVEGPMNASGVTFPGVPFVILGQNTHITWGATTNPMDVTDLFSDRVLRDEPGCSYAGRSERFCIETGGELHAILIEPAIYYLNTPGDGMLDNLVPSGIGLEEPGALLLTVPFRSFGPVVDVDDPSIFLGVGPAETRALVLQFTGFHATRELRTFRIWARARNLSQFRTGLAEFDFGSQNWAYADDRGNVAYFTSAENPLRTDLEQGAVVGLPPFFVRDGESGDNNWISDPAHSQGQAIPFAVLPAAEMPQVVNPPAGFFANANNDPAGTSLDNDPLNQHRLSNPSAIYYLNGDYSDGLRAGRITRLVRGQIQTGKPISVSDMRHFQGNTQELDAELLTPFLLQAFDDASALEAPAELAQLAADPEVAEAIDRLSGWDYSTPTGIPEGWDQSDVLGERAEVVPPEEIDASVAATIYNVWRAKLLRSVISDRLSALGVPGVGSGDALKAVQHLLSQAPFTGVGASGVDFFPEPEGLSAPERRDLALLEALRDALDALASPTYEAAFGLSTNQDDYRWGKLHRIVFRNTLGGDRNLPPDGGFEDLAPELPGLARDGGYEVVNASGYSAWADGVNAFMFGGGPVRRYVGQAGYAGEDHVQGFNAVPSIVDDPLNVNQMRFWLTVDHHQVRMLEASVDEAARRVEEFMPPSP